MPIQFPLWVPWRVKKPGIRSTIAEIRNGLRHLVTFSDHGKMLDFNSLNPDDNPEKDHIEKVETIGMLRALSLGFSFVIVNPGAQDETIYTMAQLEEIR
jgi:hypothetical protein